MLDFVLDPGIGTVEAEFTLALSAHFSDSTDRYLLLFIEQLLVLWSLLILLLRHIDDRLAIADPPCMVQDL